MSLDKFFPSKTPKRTLSSGEVSPAKKLKLDPEAMPQGEEINLPKEVVGQTSAPREPLALSFLSPFGAELVGQMKSDAWRRLLLVHTFLIFFIKIRCGLDRVSRNYSAKSTSPLALLPESCSTLS